MLKPMTLFSCTLVLAATSFARAQPPASNGVCESDRAAKELKLAQDVRGWREDLTATDKKLETLNGGGTLADHPELNAACACRPNPAGCTADFWATVMGASPEDQTHLDSDGTHGCMRIYLKFNVANASVLPASCVAQLSGVPGDAAHPGCGAVNRQLLAKQFKVRRAALKRHLEVEAPQRRLEIANDYRVCREDQAAANGGHSSLEADSQPSSAQAKLLKDDTAASGTKESGVAALADPFKTGRGEWGDSP
jgi:hypothetical protein